MLGAFSSTLFLTLINPLTIFAFAAIFAGVGAEAATGNTLGALNVVLGVFLGSSAWWLILVTLTGLFRAKLTTTGLVWVNRLSGLLILGFGVVILYGLAAPIFDTAKHGPVFNRLEAIWYNRRLTNNE